MMLAYVVEFYDFQLHDGIIQRMAHEVFISYSSNDKSIADSVCDALELNGVRCWIAPRNILPGTDWSESILDAITESSILLLVFTSSANQSQQIKREIERAVSKGIKVLPFRVENITPSKSLEFFISTQHWLNAFTPPLEVHIERLAQTVCASLKMPPRSGSADMDVTLYELTPKPFKFEVDSRSEEYEYSYETPLPKKDPRRVLNLVVKDGIQNRAISAYVPNDGYLIGRDTSNHLKLKDREVSHYHAFIILYDNHLTIVDGKLENNGSITRSTNGITVNGLACYQHRLTKGDIIQIGEHIIEVRFVGY